MKSLLITCIFTALACSAVGACGQTYLFPTSPAPTHSINPGGFSPNYFGQPYHGYSAYGYGLYGPGYYGLGGNGFGGSSPYGVDPSLHFYTYPTYSSPNHSPLVLNSGLPSLMSPYGVYPRIRSTPTTWPSRGKISLSHSADAVGNLTYSLNGTSYTIQPGYAQTFEDDRKWIVKFSDTESKKELRYTLTAGTYRFHHSQDGWNLGEVVAKNSSPEDTQSAPPIAK